MKGFIKNTSIIYLALSLVIFTSGFFMFPIRASAAISLVQQIDAGTFGSAGASQATGNFGSSVTSGNLIIVIIRTETGSVTGVTDTLGTIYTLRQSTEAVDPHQYIYSGVLSSGGTNSVTATFSGSPAYKYVQATEWSGVGSYDTGGVNTGSSATPTVNSITTAGAGLVVMGGSVANTGSYTAGTDFTLINGSIPTAGGNKIGGSEYRITTGALSGYSATINGPSSAVWSGIVVAFNEASASTPIPKSGVQVSAPMIIKGNIKF